MLSWASYYLSFHTDQPWTAPGFSGSMLRGAFGHALKQCVCAMRLRECVGCSLEYTCLYTSLFETRPPPDGKTMTRYTRVPHPFVLSTYLEPHNTTDIKSRHDPSGQVNFVLRLFGRARHAAPFALRAFEEAGKRGFGWDKTPFILQAVCRESAIHRQGLAADGWQAGQPFPAPEIEPVPEPLPETVRLRFLTPLRLPRAGKLSTVENFDPATFSMAVVRRVGLLATFFEDEGRAGLDFTTLKAESTRIRVVEKHLRWQKLFRYSNRQKARQSVGGLVGNVCLDLADAPGLRQVLAWAPVVHVGKGTSMGLGQVAVQP